MTQPVSVGQRLDRSVGRTDRGIDHGLDERSQQDPGGAFQSGASLDLRDLQQRGAGSAPQRSFAIAIVARLLLQHPLVLIAMPVLLSLTPARIMTKPTSSLS